MDTQQLLQEIDAYHYVPIPRPKGLDIERVPMNDAKTWELISSGNTKGVFQFESRLGQTWCKKINPTSILDLSDITSAIRPGTLQSKNDANESMTKVYAETKHGNRPAETLHKSIEDITKATHGVILYQEQAMQIAAKMAGFDGNGTNRLRKGIGKKDAALIKAIRTEFVNGCVEEGHTEEDAGKVFDVIQKSARYSFNKSITPDSIVEVDGELISIKELDLGKAVNTPTGPSYVTNKYDHGILDVFEITTESGKTIKCTGHHKFLCEDGSIKPLWEIILSGDRVVCQEDDV